MVDNTAPDQAITVQAPAKVNLCIHVLDRLPNGYHELWSLMHTVDVFDQLRICLNPHQETIHITCDEIALPVDQRNLVYQAVEAVLRRAERAVGVDIALHKAIPLAAGLGGGSSDAAATIFGLCQLMQLNWGLSDMSDVGAELGSDISFFFHAPCAVVRGWGQEVIPCSLNGQRWVVLVNPGFPIQTKWAYDQLAICRSHVAPVNPWTASVEDGVQLSWDDIIEKMDNDFESPLFPVYPILEFIKDKLRALGARAALLSGSGATVFGVFDDQEEAQAAARQLRHDTQWLVFDAPMGSTGLPHKPVLHAVSSEGLPV